MAGHIAVLSNPHAGKGRGRAAADAAIDHLRSAGAQVRVYAGSSAAETALLARTALDEHPRVLIVVGGDGTLSGVLPVVAGRDTPIALVPAGTGNDFARALGIPRKSPHSAAALALTGHPCRVDVGEVRSAVGVSLFLTVAALGFDARVSDRTNRLRWPRGRARYYLALLIDSPACVLCPFPLATMAPRPLTSQAHSSPSAIPPATVAVCGSARTPRPKTANSIWFMSRRSRVCASCCYSLCCCRGAT